MFGSYRSKTLKLALNGQNFAIPWPKIRHIRIFPVFCGHMETQLHAKNQKKNIERSRLQDWNGRTYGRTNESEFIGSFRSLKTSGEPTRHSSPERIKTRHSMIGSPERVKIQRSSIPKIRKIHSCLWKLWVKNPQTVNFGQNMAKFSS